MTEDARQAAWTRRMLFASAVFAFAWGCAFTLANDFLVGGGHLLSETFATDTFAGKAVELVGLAVFVAGGMLNNSLLAVPLGLLYLGMNVLLWRVAGIRPLAALAASVVFGALSGYVWFLWWRQDKFFSFQDFDYNTPPFAVPAWIACVSAGLIAGLYLLRQNMRKHERTGN